MDALPVAGFFAALVLTTYWFDELGSDQYGLPLQFVYSITWGLLGAAVLMICDITAPNTMAQNAAMLAGGLAMAAGAESMIELVKRHRIDSRNLRWLVAGIVVFGSTHLLLQNNEGISCLTNHHERSSTKWSTASKTTKTAPSSF
jgi:hypothetical protein